MTENNENLEETMTTEADALDHDETTGTDADTDRTPDDEQTTTDSDVDGEDQSEDADTDDEERQTFHRDEIVKVRKQAARYRERAKQAEARADELATRLHTALVASDGRLADPADLEFDTKHLDDPDELAAAISDLVGRKPGLRAQRFTGNAGAGKRGSAPKPPADLISIIRGM